MAGDHDPVAAHENRICPPELDDRCRNLRHLLVAVCPGIPRVRNEAVDGPAFHNEIAQNTIRDGGAHMMLGCVLRDLH